MAKSDVDGGSSRRIDVTAPFSADLIDWLSTTAAEGLVSPIAAVP
jgi:hypothetical protein